MPSGRCTAARGRIWLHASRPVSKSARVPEMPVVLGNTHIIVRLAKLTAIIKAHEGISEKPQMRYPTGMAS